jgi:acyl dehydratase
VTTLRRTISALNTAPTSENKIHDDAVASRFGFTGGLVPGVDVFAYLAHAPVLHWGQSWLTHGAMRARFGKPVYDGDDVTITAEYKDDLLALTLTARGEICATGEAHRVATGPAPGLLATAPLVTREARPQASMETLAVGTIFGTTRELYTAEHGRKHLIDAREDLALFDDGAIANPAFLLRRANYILAGHVRLGPWIHVESDIRLHGLLRHGETLETRAVVAENIEKNGHLIVAFDFAVLASDRLAMSGRHRAIYAPRQVREVAST